MPRQAPVECPYARELAALGLPKQPMLSSTVGHVEMTFGNAAVV